MASPLLFLYSLSAETVPIWQSKQLPPIPSAPNALDTKVNIYTFTNHGDTESTKSTKTKIV